MQRTMMDEILQEYEMQHEAINNLSNELGMELSEAEMHEFGSLFGRLKDLAKKGYRKMRPVIAAAKIASAMLPGAAANNVAAYIENQRNRYRDQPAIVEKSDYKDRPR